MEPKDLCDTCAHRRVCVMNRQIVAIGNQLVKHKGLDDDVTYIGVTFGVIDCPEYKEAADDA